MLIKNTIEYKMKNFFSLRVSCPLGGLTRSHTRARSERRCECEKRSLTAPLLARIGELSRRLIFFKQDIEFMSSHCCQD